MRHLNYFQLSLFGDFNALKADLLNMQKLANELVGKQFLPTVTNHQNIDVVNGTSTNELRMSLISNDGKYNVQILPERIDYISNYSGVFNVDDIKLSEFINDGVEILEIVMSVFNLESNRLALNIQFVNKIVDDNMLDKIYQRTVKFLPFYNENTVDEWQLMSNSRDKVKGIEYPEEFNTITYIMPAINNVSKVKGFMMQMDINTLQERLDKRFSQNNIKSFFECAFEIVKRLNDQFEEYLRNVK